MKFLLARKRQLANFWAHLQLVCSGGCLASLSLLESCEIATLTAVNANTPFGKNHLLVNGKLYNQFTAINVWLFCERSARATGDDTSGVKCAKFV